MKGPGLIALLGKASPSEDEEEAEVASTGGVEKEFAREAFAALKDDDVEGFSEAFVSAVRACVRKSKDSEPALEEDIDDESY